MSKVQKLLPVPTNNWLGPKLRWPALVLCAALGLAGCGSDDAADDGANPNVPTGPTVPQAPGNSTPPTYSVGKDQINKTLQQVLGKLKPGDIVELDGDQEYPGDIIMEEGGTLDKPITIRGKIINNKRPLIRFGKSDRVIRLETDFVIIDGLEVVGKHGTTKAGIGVYGDGIVVRNSIIQECNNGILGYGGSTGSVLVEYCEIHHCGAEKENGHDFGHQIYMATDEVQHRDAVFRLQHCYIHDGKGGNNVKSRSGRNEIYYNWIEGAWYHSLDLIGIDADDGDANQETITEENSDVVGNVLFAPEGGSSARMGGDGTGYTNGKYRFVNNTIIVLNDASAYWAQDKIGSIELFNNIYVKAGASGLVLKEQNAIWKNGRAVTGTNNFIQNGLGSIPSELQGTLTGNGAGFENFTTHDLRLLSSSTLINKGTTPGAGFEFPNALFPPAFHPPLHVFEPSNATARPTSGAIDLGAFERP